MSEPIIQAQTGETPTTLEKSVVPMGPNIPGAGVRFLPRADRILRHLARTADEREYVRMVETDTAISSAIDQRTQGLLAEGWDIMPGPSGTDNAARLRDFGRAIFARRSLRLQTVFREMLDAVFQGWRPAEVTWDSELRFDGPVWAPRSIHVWPAHRFKFVVDDQGRVVGLALLPTFGMAATRVFNFENQADHLRWLICTAGSTTSPYGNAWLRRSWLLWFVRQEFNKMSSQGISRALGIFKAIRNQPDALTSSTAGPTDWDGITAELAKVMQTLSSSNILIELGGWQFEQLPDSGLADNLVALNEYFDGIERIAIVGQTLTSAVGSVGSFAASKTHASVLKSYQRSDGRNVSMWMSDLLGKAIDVNFNPQPADDYPTLVFRLFTAPDLPATVAYFNMGGAVDATQLANRLNIPAALNPAAGDVVLLRQPGSAAASMPGDGEQDQRRGISRALDVRVAPAIEGASLASVDRLLEEAATAIAERNPDPA